ncbi:MAG: PQQ-dependent sugar dehydrogenase [Planctomycetaceae bacterium]
MRLHRNGFAKVFVLLTLLLLSNSVSAVADETVPDFFNLEKRVPITTSTVIGSPEPPKPYRLKRAYPQLKFEQPVAMVSEPGSKRIMIVQFTGQILAFEDGTTGTELTEVFNMDHTNLRREPYNITFHPDFVENRKLHCFAEVRNKKGPEETRIEVYEFKMNKGDNPTIDPDSERMIISWLSAGHTGGGITFGPDGLFYISTGDGTTGSDVNVTGQDITDLQAGILRIDVDHYDENLPYSIPEDNPFNHIPEARHELWAFGLRAPWRMDWDLPTETLYIGDVGQDVWEMIHVGKKGGNYGWSITEGGLPFIPEREQGPGELIKPIMSHHHTEARSITGGFVYRGDRLPELKEAYIYCDYATGKVWGLRYENGEVTWSEELADSSNSVASFGLDHQGELYHVDYGSGELLQLEPNPYLNRKIDFPHTLTATGLYESVPDNKPVAGVVSYEINTPAWHDGAQEELWLAVPKMEAVTKEGTYGWNFQDEAVVLQTLTLELEPGKQTRVETRMLTKQDGEWLGYSYLWNDEQTEATLVEKKGTKVEFNVTDAENPGETHKRTWHIPSRAECMSCHSRAANYVLSLNTLQLDLSRDKAEVANFESVPPKDEKLKEEKTVGQIERMDALGFFTAPRKPAVAERPAAIKVETTKRPPVLAERSEPRRPTKASQDVYPKRKMVNPYADTSSLDLRARSFLQANCSQCHVRDGGGNAKMELEIYKEDHKMNIFGVTPLQGNFGLADGLLIAPGDPSRSVLLYRISKLGSGHMPQVGSHAVDPGARQFLHDWILTLKPDANTPDPSPETIALQQQNDAAIEFLAESPNAPAAEVDATLTALLSNASGAMKALHAYEHNRFSPNIADKMLVVATNGSYPAAQDLFERFLPEEKRLKRLGTDFDIPALLAQQGNIERGRELFTKAEGIQCRNCHSVGENKNLLGPDLADIGKKYTREQILESIVEPSKKIEDKYKGFLVITEDGLTLAGRIIGQGPDGIVILDNELKQHTVAMDEIDDVEEQKKSLMPEQLFRDLSADQAADLLEFLSSLKQETVAEK